MYTRKKISFQKNNRSYNALETKIIQRSRATFGISCSIRDVSAISRCTSGRISILSDAISDHRTEATGSARFWFADPGGWQTYPGKFQSGGVRSRVYLGAMWRDRASSRGRKGDFKVQVGPNRARASRQRERSLNSDSWRQLHPFL